ncbi:potassium channel [Diplodia corticola]|uniref:Potassium channel n=1 Tax=Diplodia corticola TaxID=236234 RepID=A0A1J9R7E7_9PEZI|nr:potassium channel [Diplodia corticola]OJD37454.1 potassium channel [Diplodia corticola]
MNDPGVDEPISNAAQDLEQDPYEGTEKQREEEEQDFLDPSRWWFASTACPLLAGTFGPLANAFSICALVEKWRVYIPPGMDETVGTPVQDPSWLIAINAVSLACALTANLALLLNMARRLKFNIAQPITIGGFALAAVLLIALVAVASSSYFRMPPADAHALSQAFYYAIIAASLYAIISMLMVLTVYGAWKGHYKTEFRLTISQRTLMLQTISFSVYLLLGGLVFSYIEGWEFLDGVYWADYTLLTVGLGSDFPPKTHLGRSLLFPFAIGGILMVGLVVGSIRSLVLERGKAKLEARMTEVKREKVLGNLDPSKQTVRIGMFQTIHFSFEGLSEFERREQEFHVMRHIQKSAERSRRYTALGLSIAATCGLWFIGAVVFRASEGTHQGWSYFQALYFSYTSLLTIGYGDYCPKSNSGKPFFVVWSIIAVPTLTILISNMGNTVVKGFSEFTIWLGSLTVLPQESGFRATLKSNLAGVRDNSLFKKDSSLPEFEKPPGFLPHNSNNQQERDRMGLKDRVESAALNRLMEHLEEEELAEAEDAEEKHDELARDIHFYHFVLAKETRKVMKDLNASPPKQYSYQEWAYYLKLIGQDEANPGGHRKPPAKPERNKNHKADIGAGAGTARFDGDKVYAWSWLGTRSPLMGSKLEAEWILERLSTSLEHELRTLKLSKARERMEPPPISMADLKRRKLSGSAEKSE